MARSSTDLSRRAWPKKSPGPRKSLPINKSLDARRGVGPIGWAGGPADRFRLNQDWRFRRHGSRRRKPAVDAVGARRTAAAKMGGGESPPFGAAGTAQRQRRAKLPGHLLVLPKAGNPQPVEGKDDLPPFRGSDAGSRSLAQQTQARDQLLRISSLRHRPHAGHRFRDRFKRPGRSAGQPRRCTSPARQETDASSISPISAGSTATSAWK